MLSEGGECRCGVPLFFVPGTAGCGEARIPVAGGEDPGRGRRKLRSREGASVAGQRMAAIWRWLVAGLLRKVGTLGRMAANCVERGDGRCREAGEAGGS